MLAKLERSGVQYSIVACSLERGCSAGLQKPVSDCSPNSASALAKFFYTFMTVTAREVYATRV